MNAISTMGKKTFTQLAEESGRSVEDIKADVKALAVEYQKNGDSIPLSYKKAYDKIGVYSEAAEKKMKKSSEDAKDEIKDDADEISDSHKKNSEKSAGYWKSAFSGVGKAVSTGVKVFGAATGAAATGVAALGTAAVKSYADFEQLTGGVETLFGAGGKTMQEYADSVGKNIEEIKDEYASLLSAQRTVFDNADEAYKTAGLSANEYMETVTSFSASLIQSLEGDTEKAADAADQAIIDMSDNANKMGTSMEMIQNAYNGFAKQNYTMLDNLKLGYGGTKEEMQRLLDDASKISGIKYDISSFADITQAIHVMQEEMGIAGTTAAEAATTISGSIGMMKASWENLVTGIADGDADIDGLISNFVDSVGTVAENLLPRIEVALNGVGGLITRLLPIALAQIPTIITDVLPGLMESGTEMINAILEGIKTNLPTIVTGAIEIIMSLAEGFLTMLPTIIELGLQLITNLALGIAQALPTLIPVIVSVLAEIWNILSENLPQMLSMGYEMLTNLVNGFVESIPSKLPEILSFIQQFANGLAEKAPGLIEKGFALLSKLVEGIISAIPILIQQVPTIISTFANIINDNFPTILKKGVELLWQLIQGIISAIPVLIQNIPQIVNAIVDTLMAFQWLNLGKSIITFLKNGITKSIGLVKTAGKNVLEAIKGAIQKLPSTLANIGKTAITGLGSVFKSMIGFIKNAALGIVNGIIGVITALPGKMLSLGKDIVQGLIDGIKGKVGAAVTAAADMATSAFEGAQVAVDSHSPSRKFKWLGEMCVAGFDEPLEDYNPYSTLERTMRAGRMEMNMNYSTKGFDYARFGKETVWALEKAGLTISLDKRPFGRLVREVSM